MPNGNFLFMQDRVGQYGKIFQIYKIRTMKSSCKNNENFITTANDERILPFGKWLRKTKLDEIVELINVLKGDETVDPLDAITTDPSAIKITAGKITIKNGTFNTPKTAQYAFRVEGGELVVDNCEVTAWRGCVSVTGGSAIINGGKYTANGNGGGWVFYAAGNGNIIINGGTFTNNDSASRFFTTEGNGKITDNTNK